MSAWMSKAILELAPKQAGWILKNENYEEFEWFSEEYSKPTREEVEAKIEELKAVEPMRLLRIERDKLLAECDWVTIRSYNQGVPVPEEWVEYCQALRDLPETSTPVLDSSTRIGISGVTWPTKPS